LTLDLECKPGYNKNIYNIILYGRVEKP